MGIDEAEKNKKYFHYLKLIDDLIENYIKADAELIGLVKSYIPKFYDGSNNKLLAQDILYTMLQKETNNEEVLPKRCLQHRCICYGQPSGRKVVS